MKIDYKNLETLIGSVLDAHSAQKTSRGAAIGAIAHVVSAISKGNESEAASWINDPAVFERYLKDAAA